MRLVGLILLLLGAALLAAGLVIGVPFAGVYLLGFVGTGGREAGRELAIFLPATVLACGIGIGFIKLGKHLRRAG
jgi:hypothetical protein